MAKYTAIDDKNLGMTEILKNMAGMRGMAVKLGIPEGPEADAHQKGDDGKGPTVAQYAAWNEYGTAKIPARPFIRGWLENKSENIKNTLDKVCGKVCDGKWTAEEALMRLGEFGEGGIKSYIRTGQFKPNSSVTINGSVPNKKTGKKFIKGKKGSTPLIDTGTMRNSIRYEVVKQ
jgi:hypothetical protein